MLCFFTARCYAKRGVAMASHLSVCDVEVSWSYIGWNISNNLWLISPGFLLSAGATTRIYRAFSQ